jgi:hypothetical protein
LRGDVLEKNSVESGKWLIVQRYLAKENVDDPRLLLPRVNPESMHWARGERDVTDYALQHGLKLAAWRDRDWVGYVREDNGRHEILSFDLVDNAMSLVSYSKGLKEHFTYHLKEALWTKLFREYVDGEEKMEAMMIENYDKGMITFSA